MNGQRIIGIVYNKAGRAAVRLFYVLFLEIVNLNLVVVPAFGIITGEFSGFLKDAVRQFVVAGFYDDVGAGHSFGVKPPVISGCELESQLIILEIVFSHIDIKTVTGYVVERFGFRLGFLAFFVCVVTFDIAVLSELFLDLGKVTFRSGDIQSIGDRFQMRDLTFRICDLFCDGFLCTL